MTLLSTQFAPAERISGDELQRQVDYFKDPAVHTVADASPDIMLVLNRHRQAVFANHRLADVLGLDDPDVVYGQRPGEIFGCIHSRENEAGCGTTESCSTCGAVRAILNGLAGKADVQECRILQYPNNSPLDLRVYTTPLMIGNEPYTFFALSDISNEKRRSALERIFFHDIMNTAGGLRGTVWLLGMANSEAELKGIRKDLDVLSEGLIDEIKAQRQLLAAENNELVPQMDSLHTRDIFNAVAGSYQGLVVARGKQVKIDEQTVGIQFISDKTLLRRVIGNMTKNALEACEVGDTVTLGCDLSGGSLRFWVHNLGVLPREIQLQIFQRSFSSKGTGRGLGTYSMKLLGERYLKGKVSFTSNFEDGTIFQIVLPLSVQEN
jgi:hypothetical protein